MGATTDVLGANADAPANEANAYTEANFMTNAK